MADIRTMDTIVNAALAERRFALWLFEAFAVLALALAAVGIYGLLAYLVEQRRKELGIRMALGASRGTMLRWSWATARVWAASGVIVGLLVTPLAGKALVSFLYGVGTADPVSLIGAATAILMVALLASLVPALLASAGGADGGVTGR